MSARNGRRHRKKTDDDPDFRPAHRKEDHLKVKQREQEVVVNAEKMEENGKIEMKKPEAPPIIIVEEEVILNVEEKVEEANGNYVQEEIAIIIEDTESVDAAESELEPLVVDTEDPELQFDDNSDVDSYKDSPALINRCATRRSQTRNIPTPKTPKSVNESNGDEKENIEESKEQNVGPTNNRQVTQDNAENAKQNEIESCTPLCDINTETPPPTEETLTVTGTQTTVVSESKEENDHNLSVESCESALSTQVNVGSDITREIDLTLPEENSFLNTAKDLSVVETLRRMSSRRAIRSVGSDYRKTLLKAQAEKHDMAMLEQHQRVSIEKITGIKRKTRSKTPENNKRFKAETSPGFFSYISSPLSMLKNRFYGGDSMSASTPKLTSYREQEAMEDSQLRKIEDSNVHADKKKCLIM